MKTQIPCFSGQKDIEHIKIDCINETPAHNTRKMLY